MNKYASIVNNSMYYFSYLLNKGSNHSSQKIQQLQELISDGKTNSFNVERINEVLVELLFNSKETKSIISIQKKEDEFSLFFQKLEKLVSFFKSGYIDNDDPENYRNRELILGLIESELRSLLSVDIFKIEIIPVQFPDSIIEEYFENYIKSSYSDEILFTEKSVVNYLNYLESKISSLEDISDLQKQLQSVLDNEVQKIKISIKESCVSKNDYFDLLIEIQNKFGWLSSDENEFINTSLNVIKEKVRHSIVNLAIQTNSKVFPELIKERIMTLKKRNNGPFEHLIDCLNHLEEERESVFEYLRIDNLDNYYNYPPAKREVLNIQDYETSKKSFSKIYYDYKEKSFLEEFLSKRNEKGIIIKNQIQSNKASYLFVKNELEKIKETATDEVIVLFINCVKSFQEELENSIIGDLEYSFQDMLKDEDVMTFIKDIKKDITNAYIIDNKLKQAKKQGFLNKITENSFKINSSIVNEFLSKHENIEEFSIVDLTKQLRYFLSEKNEEDLLSSSDQKIIDLFSEVAKLKGSKNIGDAISSIDVVKEVLQSDSFKDLIKDVPIIGAVISTGTLAFSLGKILIESKNKNKITDNEIKEIKIRIVTEIGTSLVKEALLS